MKSIFLILIAVVVSSCTTLSKEDCQTMNWDERGKSDALKGKTSKVFADYSQTCNKHGVAVNPDEYAKGRDRGLRLFCTYENGQQFGREGKSYNKVCPQNLEIEFLKGYHIGKREYEIEQKEKVLERRKQELEKKEAKLKSRQAILSRHNTKECTFNSDCTIRGDCFFGKCERSGAKCTFDSDCELIGRCSLETICAGGDCDTINICKYD
jgi:hypothetical protein